MPAQLLVRCPGPTCQRTGRVPESFKGHHVRCSVCGRKFPVSAAALPDQPGDAEGTTSLADDRGRTGWWVPPEELSAVAPPSDLPVQIGRFKIQALLGSGAFGTVYRAHDPHLDRDVALKVLRAERLGTPAQLERFLREARAAAQLHHPHIVPVYEAGHEEDHHFIASAFIAGRTLAALCQEGPLSPRRAATLVQSLAEALAYAHEKGVVHRDVKPANVLLDEQDQPHLTDFGLAHRQDEEACRVTQEGAILGTPAYMAPEQASGNVREPQPASDQYSLGALFYALLCGRPPFRGRLMGVLHQACHVPPEPPSRLNSAVPTDLEAICLRMLAKNPGERFSSCQEVAAALKGWLADAPAAPAERAIALPTVPDLDPPRSEPPARKRRPVLVVAIVVLAVTVALGAWSLVQWVRAPERTRQKEPAAEQAPGRAPRLAPDNPQLRALQARLDVEKTLAECKDALEKGDLAVAERALVRARGLAPDNPQLRVLQAQLDNLADRRKRFRDHVEKARGFLAAGNPGQAVEQLASARALFPEDGVAEKLQDEARKAVRVQQHVAHSRQALEASQSPLTTALKALETGKDKSQAGDFVLRAGVALRKEADKLPAAKKKQADKNRKDADELFLAADKHFLGAETCFQGAGEDLTLAGRKLQEGEQALERARELLPEDEQVARTSDDFKERRKEQTAVEQEYQKATLALKQGQFGLNMGQGKNATRRRAYAEAVLAYKAAQRLAAEIGDPAKIQQAQRLLLAALADQKKIREAMKPFQDGGDGGDGGDPVVPGTPGSRLSGNTGTPGSGLPGGDKGTNKGTKEKGTKEKGTKEKGSNKGSKDSGTKKTMSRLPSAVPSVWVLVGPALFVVALTFRARRSLFPRR